MVRVGRDLMDHESPKNQSHIHISNILLAKLLTEFALRFSQSLPNASLHLHHHSQMNDCLKFKSSTLHSLRLIFLMLLLPASTHHTVSFHTPDSLQCFLPHSPFSIPPVNARGCCTVTDSSGSIFTSTIQIQSSQHPRLGCWLN